MNKLLLLSIQFYTARKVTSHPSIFAGQEFRKKPAPYYKKFYSENKGRKEPKLGLKAQLA